MAERRFTRTRVSTPVGTVSKTRASEAEATDVNRIMAKYLRTGVITHWNNRRPVYGDFSQANDYKAALDQVIEARDAFAELPAEVRKAAENDPEVFMRMLADEDGMQQLVDAGMELDDTSKPDGAPEAPSPTEPEGEDRRAPEVEPEP